MILPVIHRTQIIIAAAVVVVFLVMTANTYRLSAAVDREHVKLVQCEADKVILQGNIKTLSDAITTQNADIEKWKKQSDESAAEAERALAEVDRMSESRKQVVADLDAWKRRSGETDCDATRRLLLEYAR